MLYKKQDSTNTNDDIYISGIAVTAATRTLTGIHIKSVTIGAHNEGYYSKGIRSNGGGAGASTASAGALPETIDKAKRSFKDREQWREVLSQLEKEGKLSYDAAGDNVALMPQTDNE